MHLARGLGRAGRTALGRQQPPQRSGGGSSIPLPLLHRWQPAGPHAAATSTWRRSSSGGRSSSSRRALCSAAAAAVGQHAAAAGECAATSTGAGAAPATAQAAAAAAAAPHVPVLLQEVLSSFEGRPVRVYVDGTLGAGGHASAVLQQHPELHTLVGFDLDPSARALAAARLAQHGAAVVPASLAGGRLTLLHSSSSTAAEEGAGGASAAAAAAAGGVPAGRPPATAYTVASNFSALKAALQQLPGGLVGGVDAMLLDLGISSMQVDEAERGFSFLREGPLDMRMDPGAALSAEELVNSAPEAELGRVLREYGEERHWKGIARRIAAAREEAPITTTQQLVRAIGGGRGGGGRDGRAKHPATRAFQALRIAVNGELESLARALPDAVECLAPGGRLAIITFHSLEDRIVKWAFRHAAGMSPSDESLPSYCLPFEEVQSEASVRILTRRPLVPSEEEQRANPRSRSAKLRVVEKL